MNTKSPRQRRRNSSHSARQSKRLEQTPRYFSKAGEGLPGVSEVLAILATGNELKESLGQVVSMPSYIKPIYFTRAALTGTVVHTAAEALVKGTPFDPVVVETMSAAALHAANTRGEMDPREIGDQARKARWAYENLSRWIGEQSLDPWSVEARIIDEDLGVGMTADLVERDGSGLCVTDWKTTSSETVGHLKPALLRKYEIQLGAYAGLIGRAHGQKINRARLVFAPKHQGRDVFVVELEAGVTYTGGLYIGKVFNRINALFEGVGHDVRIVGNGAILDLEGGEICISYCGNTLDIDDCVIVNGNIRYRSGGGQGGN